MNGWFVLELMGHVRHIGYVTEVEAFGGKLGRIDVLQADGSQVTVMFGAASVYMLTPTTEEAAREMVKPYEFKPLTMRVRCVNCDELVDDCTCGGCDEDPEPNMCGTCVRPLASCRCEDPDFDAGGDL